MNLNIIVMSVKTSLLETVKNLIGYYGNLSIVLDGQDVVVNPKAPRICISRPIIEELVDNADPNEFSFYVCEKGLVIYHQK